MILCLLTVQAQAQTNIDNTFTYQGELNFNNQPANGQFDFKFEFYQSQAGGVSITSLTVENIDVNNGIFSVPIFLIQDIFTGFKIWVAISVREGSSTGAYDTLSPRQEITSAPYAIHAQFVGENAVTSGEILDSSIQTQDLASFSVTNSKLATGSVTNIKIASNSISNSKIVSNAVTESKIADNAVTINKIANNAVDANKLAAFSVNRSEISGTEIMLYRIDDYCRGGGFLNTYSTCQTETCITSPTTIYYTCSGICSSSVSKTCSNTAIGYLLSPQIGL